MTRKVTVRRHELGKRQIPRDDGPDERVMGINQRSKFFRFIQPEVTFAITPPTTASANAYPSAP
jgi:hypothetical protein